MFVSNCRWCPLPLKLTSFVLNVSKSCTLFICLAHEGILVILLLHRLLSR
ncbi:hypothetical protein Hanom_Chr07g00662411 [Helianthus anomalus]